MSQRPLFIGKMIYIFGYPILWLILHGSTRAYVLVQADTDVLVTKNWLGLHKKWRLPGGGVKAGEDPKSAIVRELKEEVGIIANPNDLQLLQSNPLKCRQFGYTYSLYSLKMARKPPVVTDNHEIAQATFIDAKTNEVPLSEEAKSAVKLANIG